MKKKVISLLVLLTIIISISIFIKTINDNKNKNILTLYGNVDIREVNLSFRTYGLIRSMKYEEGENITKGEVIASIDDSQYLDQKIEVQEQANAQKAKLDRLLAGTRVEQIEQSRALVKEKEALYANAKYQFELNQKGLKAGVVSQKEYETSLQQSNQALASLTSSREKLLEDLNGPRIEDIQEAKATLNSLNAKLANINKTVSYTSLVSPSNGTILTKIKEPGSYVNQGEAIYSVALISPKWIQAYVDEKNLGKIKPNMPVEINNDSYPDKTYKGTIGFISPTAEFTPKTVETPELRANLVYRFRINVNDPENELRQGMPVTITIKTGTDFDEKSANKNK